MYKDGDYRGLSLEDVIWAIHEELEENRAFLQMSLLDPDPDPDNRPAEALRMRKIMELAGVMEDVLDTLVAEACEGKPEKVRSGEKEIVGEESQGEAADGQEAEADNSGYVYTPRNLTPEEGKSGHIPGSEGGVDLEYKIHTLGCPDGGDNIEQDWDMDAMGNEMGDIKQAKKKEKKKKGKKSKKDKKGKKKKKK